MKLLILLLLIPSLGIAKTEVKSHIRNYPDYVEVIRVVDGDTFKAKGEVEFTVRTIGNDTPETKHPRRPVECFGPEATEFAKEKLLGKTVKLVYGREKHDRYGRVLAYVYYPNGKLWKLQKWKLYNVESIRTGHAYAYKKYPHKYMDRFMDAESYARRNRKGLWLECY